MTPTLYRLALDKIVQKLLLLILPIIRTALRGGSREARVRRATKLILPIMRSARSQIGDVTAEFIKAQAREQTHILNPYIPPIAGYAEDAVESVLNTAIDDMLHENTSRNTAVENAAADFVRHAENAGRQMIQDAVEPYDTTTPDDTIEEQHQDDKKEKDSPVVPDKQTTKPRDRAKDRTRPVAWARGLTGAENCAFCVMLASRGAVYKTAETASRSWEGTKYHRHCDCVAIPVFTSKDWPGKEQADAAYAFWLDSTRGYSQQGAINAFRRALYERQQAGQSLYPGFIPMRKPKKKNT